MDQAREGPERPEMMRALSQARSGRTAAMALAVVACWAGSLLAAGQVELEIVSDKQTAITAAQQWMRALGQAGVRNVRIRQAGQADKMGIDVRGTEQDPIYSVTAMLDARGELTLPGGRFELRDAARLAQWLKDLADKGPPDQRPQKSAFGLEAAQFERVRADLARPVTFSTKAVTRDDLLQRIARGLQNSIQLDPATVEALKQDKVAEELSGLSSGTAIACVLRPAGYCMVPAVSDGRVAYTVVRAAADLEIWPVGWAPEKSRREVLPALYEFLSVNIRDVTAAAALEEIAQRLKVPYLLDHNALARHGIDPAKVRVSLPQSRTFYSKALDRVLFQAGLKAEVRVDEAGKPFLWITSIKPL